MKITDDFKTEHCYHTMLRCSFDYEWDSEKDLRITISENSAELDVSYVYKDGDIRYLDEKDTDFWVGAVLYWYDAMEPTGKPLHKLQINSISRLSRWLGYVPHEDYIIKYAMPNSDEALSYNDQIDLLAKDDFEFAKKLKMHKDNFKNAEGAD